MEFYQFKKDVEAAFIKMMEAGKLFTVNVDNDLLWMRYLLSFPEGEERQSHNWDAEVIGLNPICPTTHSFCF